MYVDEGSTMKTESTVCWKVMPISYMQDRQVSCQDVSEFCLPTTRRRTWTGQNVLDPTMQLVIVAVATIPHRWRRPPTMAP